MRRSLLLAREKAGALEHHVDLEVLPGQLGRAALRAHLDPVTVHDHGVARHGHGAGKFPVYGVVARQMRVGLGVAQIVDGDELQVVALPAFIVRAQDIAADAAVAVDGDSNAHAKLLRYFKTLFAAFTTLSTVKPKCSNS